MDIFIIILLGIYYIAMLIGCFLLYYTTFINKKRSVSQVHFYVARDQNGLIYLYLGRPARRRCNFLNHGSCSYFITNEYNFKQFGINPDDFKDLKWEDEPIEVFPKIKD